MGFLASISDFYHFLTDDIGFFTLTSTDNCSVIGLCRTVLSTGKFIWPKGLWPKAPAQCPIFLVFYIHCLLHYVSYSLTDHSPTFAFILYLYIFYWGFHPLPTNLVGRLGSMGKKYCKLFISRLLLDILISNNKPMALIAQIIRH